MEKVAGNQKKKKNVRVCGPVKCEIMGIGFMLMFLFLATHLIHHCRVQIARAVVSLNADSHVCNELRR